MENQRIRISKQLLKDALIDILQEKNIKKITVFELCGRAQINRTTFYKYYGSPYDLLEEIENDVFSKLEEYLEFSGKPEVDKLTRTFEYLEEDRKKCRLLINNAATDEDFAEKLFAQPMLKVLMDQTMPGNFQKREIEYIRTFMYQGGYAVIKRWINSEERETPQEMANLVLKMELTIVDGLLNHDNEK